MDVEWESGVSIQFTHDRAQLVDFENTEMGVMIRDSRKGYYEEFYLLGYNAM
jgi:hypothetical protein